MNGHTSIFEEICHDAGKPEAIPQNIDRELVYLHRKIAKLDANLETLVKFITKHVPKADYELLNLTIDRSIGSDRQPSTTYRDRD